MEAELSFFSSKESSGLKSGMKSENWMNSVGAAGLSGRKKARRTGIEMAMIVTAGSAVP